MGRFVSDVLLSFAAFQTVILSLKPAKFRLISLLSKTLLSKDFLARTKNPRTLGAVERFYQTDERNFGSESERGDEIKRGIMLFVIQHKTFSVYFEPSWCEVELI